MRYETVPAHRAGELVARGAQLVDVRERWEVAAGTHPDAVHIPLAELAARLHELRPRRPVAVVCNTGNRSAEAARLLVSRGFHRVIDLVGGLDAARRPARRAA